MKLVHNSDWASQPNIHIRCDDRWTTPAWVDPLRSGVYLDDDGKLYTFEAELTTCPACLAAMEKKHE